MSKLVGNVPTGYMEAHRTNLPAFCGVLAPPNTVVIVSTSKNQGGSQQHPPGDQSNAEAIHHSLTMPELPRILPLEAHKSQWRAQRQRSACGSLPQPACNFHTWQANHELPVHHRSLRTQTTGYYLSRSSFRADSFPMCNSHW